MDDVLKGMAGIAINIAPALGAALGGPVGGAVGSVLRRAVAPILGIDGDDTEALGKAVSERPDEVAKAIDQVAGTPDKFSALIALAGEETKQLAIVNETARMELASEDRFVKWARPACIWSVAVTTCTTGMVLVFGTAAALYTRDVAMLNAISTLTSAAVFLLGPASAVAGVAAYGRTKEKLAAAETAPANPISAVIGGVANAATAAIKGTRK